MSSDTGLKCRRTASADILNGSIPVFGLERAVTVPFEHLGKRFNIWHALERRRTIEPEISKTMLRSQIAVVVKSDGTPAAFLQATAYRLNGTGGDTFFETCDAYSQEAYDVAKILRACWDLDALRRQDDILVLERIAIHPDTERKGLMTALLAWALPQLAASPVITLLEAFPLQFEFDERPDKRAFKALQLGLLDYYKRKMGLDPLPGKAGKEGWLFRSSLPFDLI